LAPPAPPGTSTLSLHDALPILRPPKVPCVGRKRASRIFTPVRSSSLSAPATSGPHQGAPKSSKGRVVPRPSHRVVPSSRPGHHTDRKSTRLNSSHVSISYAVFC